ncbi:MAG: hypothetical protein HC820_10395 [Hydrococcus sp. RM1_1_31]|nr:hypothetical protein [Hydrococcus sp. RM1_1_31]
MAIQSLDFSENLTLKEVYQIFISDLQTDCPSDIPFIIWLLENPDSPLALSGNIYLRDHDYLHILLDCDRSSTGEGFVIGFTMGNDPATNWFYLQIFKLASRFFYPKNINFPQKILNILI